MLARVGGLLGLVLIVFWLYAIFDSLTTPPERVRALPKGVWVLIVLLFSALGGALWMVFGRPYAIAPGSRMSLNTGGHTSVGAPRARPNRGRAAPRRSIAPDDDVDFLRQLDRDLKRRGDDGPALT